MSYLRSDSDEEEAVTRRPHRRVAYEAPGSDEDEEGSEGGSDGDPLDRDAIYNVDLLHEKLEDIGWVETQPWEESQVITTEEKVEVEDVEDDTGRELAFYNQALSAVHAAMTKFQDSSIDFVRPIDFYAEMVKSDGHMNKVKAQLMYEQKVIEEAEERRKNRASKKFAKAVDAEKKKNRAQEKKSQIDKITKLRKQRAKGGYEGEVDVDAVLRAPKQGGNKASGQRIRAGGPAAGDKRQYKNAKFGFGGRKRAGKQNDATSAADTRGYKQGKFGVQGGVKKGGKKPAAAARPGKARRAAARGGHK